MKLTRLKAHLTHQLRTELVDTCRRASFASLILLFLYELPFAWIRVSDSFNWFVAFFLFLSYLARVNLPKLKNISDRRWLNLHALVVGSHSVLWASLLLNHTLTYAHSSYNELLVYTYIVFAGLNAGASYALSMSKKDFYVFVTPLLFAQVLAFFLSDYSLSVQLCGALTICVFFLFLYFQRERSEKSWFEQRRLNFELQKIIDAVPGGISVLQKGVYTITNRYVKNLSKDYDKMLGKPLGSHSPPDNIFLTRMQDFMKSPDIRTQFEAELSVRGQLRIHLVTASKSFLDEVVISTIDIHDTKLIENEMAQQKTKLEYSAKMAALGEMSGGLAHEINNPVAIISGKAQQLMLMQENGSLSREVILKGLENINNTAERINRIIKSLRNFSHGDAEGEVLSSCSVHSIIEETLTFCEAKFRHHGVNMSYDIQGNLQLECRPIQISQVLLNALNNSYDAIQNCTEKWIRISALNDGQYARITVTDSGGGIPIDIRDKIMQPFFSTKEIGKGTGLGLSISKGIIESHNGQLYFDHNSTNTQLVILIPLQQYKSNPAA